MDNFQLSCRVEKQAQVDAALRTAQSLFKIIQFLFYRVPEKDKSKFFARVRGKIIRLSPAELGVKELPPTSAIGQAITLAKNLLFGLNPVFIRSVLMELTKILATKAPHVPPPPPGQKI